VILKPKIPVSIFLTAYLILLLFHLLRHSLSSCAGSLSFEDPGLGWIAVNVALNGTLGAAIVLAVRLAHVECVNLPKQRLASLCCAMLLLASDSLLNYDSNLNDFIRWLGSKMTSWALVPAKDAPLPSGVVLALASNTYVFAVTPLGPIELTAGLLRMESC
jgi:hypothetical protein